MPHQHTHQGRQGHLDESQQGGRGAGHVRKGCQRAGHGLGHHDAGAYHVDHVREDDGPDAVHLGNRQPGHAAAADCRYPGAVPEQAVDADLPYQSACDQGACHVANHDQGKEKSELLRAITEEVDDDEGRTGQKREQAAKDEPAAERIPAPTGVAQQRTVVAQQGAGANHVVAAGWGGFRHLTGQ